MIRTKIDENTDLGIEFSYSNNGKTTTAAIYIGQAGATFSDFEKVTEASATCYYKDTQKKFLGRKMALAKALGATVGGELLFSYDDRTKVWKTYHTYIGRLDLVKK